MVRVCANFGHHVGYSNHDNFRHRNCVCNMETLNGLMVLWGNTLITKTYVDPNTEVIESIEILKNKHELKTLLKKTHDIVLHYKFQPQSLDLYVKRFFKY